MTMPTFGQRLGQMFLQGRRLCVGIDPHESMLESWGLPVSASGAEKMGHLILDASLEIAAAVKPQVAFFERFGSDGYRALESLLERARASETLVIADAKRGDIGSSFDAYADAWLREGSPLESDAMTVNPFQGFGVLYKAIDYCLHGSKGLFVLAATSNPEAREIQTATTGKHDSVSASILREIRDANAGTAAAVGSVGAVLGATVNLSEFGIETDENVANTPIMPILAPGFGHQGGTVSDVQVSFGAYLAGMLVSESRSLYAGGPDRLAASVLERSDAIRREMAGVTQ